MTRARPCMRAAATVAGLLASASLAWADVTVILRGTGESLEASSVLGDGYGLALRLDAKGGAPRMLGWDEVREVRGATGVAGLGEFLDIGRDLWRARTRIERGDMQLAQPLLAKHWARFRDVDGPTTAMVAEGMLRCALDAGDIRASVGPWLVCLRTQGAGNATRFAGLPAVIDGETGLLPELAPFIPAARRQDVIAACEASGASGEVGDVAARIVRIAKGEPTAAKPDGAKPAAATSRAVQALALIEDIAFSADARALERALAAFERAFEEPPGYLAAWRLAAIGTCRARFARTVEGDGRAGALGRAAIDLLEVPASGLDRTGLVDAYALEEAARLVRESGDDASAAQLESLARDRLSDRVAASGAGGTPKETP